ncbi:MAG TPA: hypothetical protein VGS07_00370 [Thermoanaerobaculia bacterium]|nr:hypothetical protein [Thermoanaerobaculia bacterium]
MSETLFPIPAPEAKVDGGGGVRTVKVGFQGAKLFGPAFEEVSQREEGEVGFWGLGMAGTLSSPGSAFCR